MDRLEAMTILLRVVDRGSFSAASRDLRVPLATVSRKVNELEVHLGTRLLIRTTRKVALTDAGTTYVASARHILDEIDETERVAAAEFHIPRGELILTAPAFFGRLHVLPIVTEFLAAYPEINVRLLLADRHFHLIEDHVDSRMTDLGAERLLASSALNSSYPPKSVMSLLIRMSALQTSTGSAE
jgi:DNA-binding transcriptional LysR family regulator